ncbi:MAG: acetylglutamate kinase [Acidobacteriota bacterium]
MILVVKLGGSVLGEAELLRPLCQQIAQVARDEHELVVVHGGGKQLTHLSRRLGDPVVQHQGRRVTDEATLEAAKMAFSAINRTLVSQLLAAGVCAVGIASYDGGLITCRKRPPLSMIRPDASGPQSIQQIDFGLVGEVENIDPSVLERFWESGFVPVISCLGADRDGQIFNINADTLAAELAVKLQASRLISVSDVEGIYLDVDNPSSCVRRLTVGEARSFLEEGRLTDGMIPKVETALSVLDQGVPAVQIVSGLTPNALVDALDDKTGTTLVP